MGKLQDKVAVITGGSTGMGLSTAALFVREGAKVVITGRDRSALDAAVRTIGDGVETLVSDISKLPDIEVLRTFVEDRYGRVDILFANAGGGRPGAFETVTEDDFDFGSDTNFKGTFFTVQK
ncbi:MAG: SDR family NAD(P)-dependent oxidoreductase, partial [Zymomonas sp.]